MIAVIETGSKQFIVKKGDILEVELLNKKVGEKVVIPAMMVSEEDGKNMKVGKPFLEKNSVECKVLGEGKQDKLRVFKMIRRHRHRVSQGHRQKFTELEITDIK